MTDHLPVSTERLYWNRAALLDLDAELSRIEWDLRPEVMAACLDVIARYADPAP